MQIIFILVLESVIYKIAGSIVYMKSRDLINIFPQNKMAKEINDKRKKVNTRKLKILDLQMTSSVV